MSVPSLCFRFPVSCLRYCTNPWPEWQRLQLARGDAAPPGDDTPAPSERATSRLECLDCRQRFTLSWLPGLSWQTAQAATSNSCNGFTKVVPSSLVAAVT